MFIINNLIILCYFELISESIERDIDIEKNECFKG